MDDAFGLPVRNRLAEVQHSLHATADSSTPESPSNLIKTSPTVQAWAMHPRGVNGASPSKISLNVPRPCEVICFPSGSRKRRAALRSWYTRRWAKTNGPISQPHTVPW